MRDKRLESELVQQVAEEGEQFADFADVYLSTPMSKQPKLEQILAEAYELQVEEPLQWVNYSCLRYRFSAS